MIPNEPANFSAVFLLMKKSLIFRYVKYSMSFNIFTIVFPHIWPPKRGGTYRVGHLRPSVSFTGVNALQIQMVKLHVLDMSYNSVWALVLYCLRGKTGNPANHQLLETQASKRPYGSLWAKPARPSAFIGVSTLMDTEALAGFAMPARASALDRF